jgi:hypothetical protein
VSDLSLSRRHGGSDARTGLFGCVALQDHGVAVVSRRD